MSTKPEKRRGKGKPFQKGHKLSKGRPPVYQDYNVRAKHLLDKYTVAEVTGMVRAMSIPKDKRSAEDKEFHKRAMAMAARDFTILMSIASAFTTGGALPFAALLDRAIGKTTQHIKVDQTITDERDQQDADKDAEDMLKQLAKRKESKAKTVH